MIIGMQIKGGDKLTLNLTGSSNLAKNTNAGQSNLASPTSKVFTSPPLSAGLKSDNPTLLPSVDLMQEPDDRTTNPMNGVTTSTNDTVTVTHFSEKRGTIEKILFNAEFEADSSKSSATKSSTNPFLNTSPVAVTSTHTTNPFHVSLTTSPLLEPEILQPQNNEHIHTNEVSSICSENNNDTIATTLISKKEPLKSITTNPFTIAIDEIDNDQHNTNDKIKFNNNDAFNNLKNNNINDKTESSLDEINKNKKYIEVI